MADFYIRVQVANFSAAYRLYKILDVRAVGTFTSRSLFAVTEGYLPAFSADRDRSIVTIEDIAVLVSLMRIRRPQSHFIHKIHIIIFKGCDLCIGRFMVIIV